MKFTLAAAITAFASAVYAQVAFVPNSGVAVNLPFLGEVINAGNTFVITWSPIPNYVGPSANINSIALLNGGSGALSTSIQNILAAPIPVSPAQYSWNVPVTQATLPSYVLALTGDNGNITYSNYFTILAVPAGTATNYTAAAPSAVTSGTAGKGTTTSGNGTTSGTASSAKASESSAATSFKAGIVGAAGIVSAIALLL